MALPSYNLAVQGYVGFTRVSLSLAQRRIARDPLSGPVNSSNRVFYTNFAPLLSSGSNPLRVYSGGSTVTGSADYDTGEITLDAVPTSQPLATYTYSPYTGAQIMRFLINGFAEMEGRWRQGYQLLDSLGVLADENSDALFVCNQHGEEPVCGSLTFSTSIAQQALLMACADYAYNLAVMGEAARTDHMLKEGNRGMMIDKTRRPGNIELLMKRLDDQINGLLYSAQAETLGGSIYGAFIASPLTLDYLKTLEWQTSSKEGNTRSQAGYHLAARIFN